MKIVTSFLMAILMVSSFAKNKGKVSVNKLILKADSLSYLIDDNSDQIRGRRNLDKRKAINKILNDAMTEIDGIISQSHSIDLPPSFFTSVRTMCRNTGTWEGDRRCYVSGLQSETNFTVQIIMACNSIPSNSNASNCFHRALGQAENNVHFYSIMGASCRNTGTWEGDRACYEAGISNVGDFSNLSILKGACGSITSNSGASNCFHKSLNLLINNNEVPMRSVIKIICRNTGTWEGDRACYMGGLEPLRNESVEIRVMLNSCSAISGNSGSANCFHTAL